MQRKKTFDAALRRVQQHLFSVSDVIFIVVGGNKRVIYHAVAFVNNNAESILCMRILFVPGEFPVAFHHRGGIFQRHVRQIVFQPRTVLRHARKIRGHMKTQIVFRVRADHPDVRFARNEYRGESLFAAVYLCCRRIQIECTGYIFRIFSESEFQSPRSDFGRIGLTHKNIFKQPFALRPLLFLAAFR